MGYTDFEDEGPCLHHRSKFDTIPAPPPDNCHVLKDPVFILSRYGREKLKELGVDVPPRKASEPTMLSFRGGEVELPKPTRADLVLSAQQWATRAKEELFEFEQAIAKPATNLHEMQQQRYQRPVPAAIGSALDRLDAILKELADVTR